MTRSSLLVLGAVICFPAASPRGGGIRAPAGLSWAQASQQSLEAAADRFAQAWLDRDIRTLGEMLRPSGIRLHIQGEEHHSLSPRQVRAAVEDLTDRYPGGEIEMTRVAPAGGDPALGFADLLWRTGAPGRGEVVTFTLFVAFAREGEAWGVTEIRVLSPSFPWEPFSASEPWP